AALSPRRTPSRHAWIDDGTSGSTGQEAAIHGTENDAGLERLRPQWEPLASGARVSSGTRHGRQRDFPEPAGASAPQGDVRRLRNGQNCAGGVGISEAGVMVGWRGWAAGVVAVMAVACGGGSGGSASRQSGTGEGGTGGGAGAVDAGEPPSGPGADGGSA